MARVSRLRQILLAVLLASAAGAAWAMPPLLAVAATYAIEAAVTAAVITAATATALTAGVFVSTLVFGVVQQRRAARDARNAASAALTDRYAPGMSSADAPWQIIYGECPVGPVQVAAELTSGSRDQFKHVVYVWAAHECDAVTDFLVNGVSVGALDANGWVTGGKFFKGATATDGQVVTLNGSGAATLAHTPTAVHSIGWNSTGLSGDSEDFTYLLPGQFTVVGAVVTVNAGFVAAWAGRSVVINYSYAAPGTALLRVRHHLGSDTQTADTALLAECPSDWTANDRLRGLCYSVATYCLDEPEFQGGPPDAKARIRGKKLYDHRTGLTVWSDTAALCVADFMRAEYGKRATTNQMGWASFDAGANACEEALATHGGAKRFTINGAFRTDTDADATLDALCQAMAGFVTWDGTWNLQAGVYTAPVQTITDADNAGSVEVVADQPGDEIFNGLRGRFFDPARFDQLTDYTPYQNSGFVTADNGALWAPLDLPFTNSDWRAHNLARIQVERSRGMQIVYPAKLRTIRLKPGQRVALGVSVLGIPGGSVFRVVKREYKIGQPVKLTLQQDAASMYDEADAPAPLDSPATLQHDPFVVATMGSLSVLSGDTLRHTMADGTVISRVTVTVPASTDALVTAHGAVQVEYRLENETTWQRAPEASGTATKVTLQGLKDKRRYMIRARWRNGLGALGDWRVIDVLVLGKADEPGNVAGLDAVPTGAGVEIVWTANTESDYAATELRVGASWAAGVRIFKAPGTKYFWPQPAAATYTVWAKHWDTSGNESLTAVSISVVSVSWVATGGCVVAGNAATVATLAGGSFTAQVYSAEAFVGGAYAACNPGGARCMFGLNSDPTTDANYTSIDYAMYWIPGTGIYKYESGTGTLLTASAAAGDKLAVTYDGYKVRYVRNGTVIGSTPAASGLKLSYDYSAYAVGDTMQGMRFGPMSGVADIETQQIVPGAASDTPEAFGASAVNANSNATPTQLISLTVGPYDVETDVLATFSGTVDAAWGGAGPSNTYVDLYLEDSESGAGATVRVLGGFGVDNGTVQASHPHRFILPANTTGWVRAYAYGNVQTGSADWTQRSMLARVHKL